MNKRGFLLAEETLKILIAVICIVFLAFFIIALYNSRTGGDKIKEAKDNLDRIEEIVLSLQEGETQSQDIPNPKSWHLYSFIGEEKPNLCLGGNCLCICASTLIEGLKSQVKKCDDKGSCLIIQNLVSSNLDIRINGPDESTFIAIKRQNEKILIGSLK